VDFEVTLSEENMNIAKQEGLVKKFKLTPTLAITNMHLFGPDGKIRKYETPEESRYPVCNNFLLTNFFLSPLLSLKICQLFST
jgi:DNA topoisomerase-2